MGQDRLNFDRPEQEIADEARRNGHEYYAKPLPWVKLGEYMEIGHGCACLITELERAKGGKHGVHGYKKRIAGIDVLTGLRRETELYERYAVIVPFVEKKEYLLINVTFEGVCTLMDEATNEQREDLSLPEGELGDRIREAFNTDDVVVTVVSVLSKQAIAEFRKKSE